LKILPLLTFLLISMTVLSQTTFTVVCDRTDEKVKVVESTMHSPDFVPIRGGFPFRRVAQKWITENYPSGFCNPDQQAKNNAAETNNTGNAAVTQPQNIQPQNTQPVQSPGKMVPLPPIIAAVPDKQDNFRNTSLHFNVIFANLGGEFHLSKNMVPGFELGIDLLFGKELYLGSGLNFDFYFTDFDGLYGYYNEPFFLARFPIYVGYRKIGPKLLIMMEAGTHLNAKLTSLDPEWAIPGKITSGDSFDLMGRLKIGNGRLLLEFGSNYWLTGLYKNDDFRMTTTFIGGRVFF
jgi:hypothetical protein